MSEHEEAEFEVLGTCPACFDARMPQRDDGVWDCSQCGYQGDRSYEEILRRDNVG